MACGTESGILMIVVSAGMDLPVCSDFVGCCRRFRLGMNPAQFQVHQAALSAG